MTDSTWPRVSRADTVVGEPLTATGMLRSITLLDEKGDLLPAPRARIVLEVEIES